ncbi:hypothetical protein AQJ67_26735 [Streptomyces caeruleatus]|uniref:Uncharacterized protein n=1 Tax=Streptomyces caeruleatus TaxID=661399 RepID=A0A117RMJ1_9ACTN|nr:hypothetical protein AQJ67_26735 [Streptomyces caeruleatus]
MEPFLGVSVFVWSYECFAPPDTGKSTKRPTVSNDTGTPAAPHGTGAWPEGSVWGGRPGNAVVMWCVHEVTAHSDQSFIMSFTKGKTLT